MSVDQFLLSANTTDLNYPEIRPTLDLNFARVKALDPRITFTRSSGGSYVGADGILRYAGVNEARFDHNPVTGESLGLLVEESRQNLLTYSEDFTTTWITGNATIQSNVITAPDGSSNADKLIENTSNGQHSNYFSRTGSNETLTFSVFCKAAERTRVILQLSNFVNATINVTYNLSTGTIISISASNADYTNNSASIIPYPNGWYRCILTTTKGSVNTTNIPTISTLQSTSGTYQGDGTSGIYIWGAQLEQGSFPTSYIPTTTSSRTRAADNAQITGTNFSSWYNQSEGTLYTESNSNNLASGGTIFIASNSSYSERYAQLGLSGNVGYGYGVVYFTNSRVIGGGSFTLVGDTYANGAYKKIAVSSIAANFNGVSTNQVIVNSKENLYPSGIIQARIGSYNSVTSFLNGTIKRLTYWPKRLPNAQLQALTR